MLYWMSVASIQADDEEGIKQAFDEEFDEATSERIADAGEVPEACGHTCSGSCCTLSII